MPTPEPHLIDVHHHFLPPDYVRALERAGQAQSGGSPLPPWSAEEDLAVMDRQGIATAVLSIPSPGVHLLGQTEARDVARSTNETAADLKARHPARFRALASLPLPDTEACLRELEHALDSLRLDGVVLPASVAGRYQGDPAFAALYSELDRRAAVVFLHPETPPGSDALATPVPAFLVDFPFDTTRAVASLLLNGVLDRHPNIRWILAHAGGAVPYLAGRLALGRQFSPPLAQHTPQGVEVYLRRLHYDTALSATSYAFAALRELVGSSQVLFGSDYPFAKEPIIAQTRDGIVSAWQPPDQVAIERTNALRLFPVP